MAVKVVGGRSFPFVRHVHVFFWFRSPNQWGLDAAAATCQRWSDRITRMTDTDKAKILAAGGLFKAHLKAFDPLDPPPLELDT